MFSTEIIKDCAADSVLIEEICDSFMMKRTVDNVFACAASSEAASSALNFGFSEEVLSSASAGDILLSVDAMNGETAASVLSHIKSMITAESENRGRKNRNPEIGLGTDPSVNWALIRLPSDLAPRAAQQCLRMGKGVILEEGLDISSEAELKKTAAARGLPLLGGGVQGAVIAGRSLGICPRFRSGKVSILGQSLTSNIMLAFLLERRGVGIRHLISTGRRDCYKEEGGTATALCLEEMISDEDTDSICLLLKSGDLGVLGSIVDRAAGSGKKVFLYSVGLLKSMDYEGKNDDASSLAFLADEVASYYGEGSDEDSQDEDLLEDITAIHRLQLRSGQKFLRGFFLSETMCGEIASLLIPSLRTVYSNSPVRGALLDPETRFPKENSVIDCARSGQEASSRTSMLATVRRNRRMESEAFNRSVAVILADWYGVEGSTDEQLRDMADSIRRCIETASKDGRHLAVGVAVIAGEGSLHGPEEAAEVLSRAGADVFFSADDAAEYARRIIAGGNRHE